jgi:CheY-like chemotaxis protein
VHTKYIEREKMCILLADDNPEVRSALRLLLEQEPVPVSIIEAPDIQCLCVSLQECCPVAVLLDWELPGPDRHDLLSRLRSQCPEMKVIALSSKYEARQEALATGVDAFVSKAEPPEQILATLCSIVPIMQSE